MHHHRHRPSRPRARFLRSFTLWSEQHPLDRAFRLRPILRRRDHLRLAVTGVCPALTILVCQQEVRVDITHEGRVWDILECFEAWARRGDAGYHCDLCLDQQRAWPTREALWTDHCYEPLAAWMAGPLALARWLDLCAIGGTTWAALSDGDVLPADLVHRLPIRL
jgi:hypothetical protein